MENFVFGNLTHHKGLVPESTELQFIDKLCFQKLIRMHFSDMFLYVFSYETSKDTLRWMQ